MTQRLVNDLSAYLMDPGAWLSWAVSAILGLACLGVGLGLGRRTGLLRQDASTGENVGIGLGLGLLVVASTYAAWRSGLASAFTPVLIALICAVVANRRPIWFTRPRRRSIGMGLICGAFLAGFGIVYGVTIAPSVRDGVQPMEFMDQAFYSVLGVQLQATGVESVYLPAGFGALPGLPERSWYHWGEMWLAAVALEVPGVSPMQARHAIVLPLLLLSSACTVGALAARLVASARRSEAFLFAAFGMLTIAPVPLVLGDHFDWWARPIGFTVTQYGLAFVVAAIALHAIVTSSRSGSTLGRSIAFGAIAAALVASHVLIAAMAAVAVGTSAAFQIVTDRTRMDWLRDRGVWSSVIACVIAGAATIGWGMLSGHGFASDGVLQGVPPFATAWQRSIILSAVGAGAICLGLVAAALLRRQHQRLFTVTLGASGAVIAGALIWGARLADYNSFHIYFGTVAILLTPVAVVALVVAAIHARDQGRDRLALGVILVLSVQGAIGIAATIQRLYEFGPGHYRAVPVDVLDFMRGTPGGARFAYSCVAFEEVATWDARLVSLTAHTGRTVVPMCFQADAFRLQLGQALDPMKENPWFARAPQRELYPSADARPAPEAIIRFLRANAIAYIYQDPDHQIVLVPGAQTVFRSGHVSILAVPEVVPADGSTGRSPWPATRRSAPLGPRR